MSAKLTLAAAAFVALGTFAAHANPGADQLAARAGVDPGVYSINELARIIHERQEENRANDGRLNFELNRGAAQAGRAATGRAPSAGEIRLARSLGVEPGVYSLNELTRLLAETSESGQGNKNRTKFILERGKNPVSRDNGARTISAGERQLADSLGVEPGRYSLNALTRLFAETSESGQGTDARTKLILERGY